MATETVDLRDLILMIKEKKEMEINLALEFDCRLEVDDYKPLVKVLNYAINYVNQLASQPMQVSLNMSSTGYLMGFTAFTTESEFPPLNPQVGEALQPYHATITLGGEPGKFVKLLLTFTK